MRRSIPIALVLAVASAAGLFADVVERTIVIPIAHDAGWRVTDKGRRPVATPVDLTFEEGGEVVGVAAEAIRDTLGASTATEDGTTYIDAFKRLAIHYVSDGRHAVTLWGRIRQPNKPVAVHTMGYTWSSNRAFEQQGLDPKAQTKKIAGTWRWVKLRTFNTAAGVRTIELKYAHPGTPDIAMLAIARGDASPEATRPTPRLTSPEQWTLATRPVRLSGLTRLVSAKLVGDGVQAQAPAIETSRDGGETWQAAREALVPEEGFRLRARYGQFPGDAYPTHFLATVMVDENKAMLLQDETISMTFDIPRAGVFRIESPERGVTYAAPVEAMPLFSIELKKRGEPWPDPRKVLEPKDGRLIESALGNTLMTMTWGFLDGDAIKVTARARLEGDGRLGWSLNIVNRSDWDVLTYTYPRLAGLRVGADGYDDRWANTNLYGPWMAGFRPEDRPYPGWGALGWVDLYDEDSGIGFAVRDVLESETSFELRRDASAGNDACRLEAVKKHCIASGEERTWRYTMLLHPGRWHATADMYGRWFRDKFGVADHFPDWARDSNGWINTNACLQRNMQWEKLLDAFEAGRQFGVDWVQVWGQFGSSSCSSFWWPSPAYGSIDEFARVNREIRNRGGHIGYYLMYDRENRYNLIDDKTYEGYLPQDRYPDGVPMLSVEEFVKGMRVTDPEGKLTGWPQTDEAMAEFRGKLAELHAEDKKTIWAPGSMWKLNPRDDDWREHLVTWTCDLYVDRWNCDTAYQDVLGCGHAGRSFDLRRGDHGHIYGGANMEIARLLTEEGVKRDPAFALSAEGKSELVTRWAMGMTSNRHYGWIYLDTHRFTHPDHILVLGASNGGYRQMLYNTELAYLYGAKVDLATWADYIQTRPIMKLREAIVPYVARATYRDTVGIAVRGDDVLARRFERTDGGADVITVLVVNRSGTKDGQLDVDVSRFDGEPYRAFMLSSSGETEAMKPVKTAGALTTWAAPASRASALLLVRKPAKGEETIARVMAQHHDGVAKCRVALVHLDGTPRKMNLKLVADGLNAKTRRTQALVTMDDEWTGTGLDGDPAGWYRLYDGDTLLAEDYLEPVMDDPSFERTGAPLADAPDGERAIVLNPGKGHNATHRRLNLTPGGRYTFRLKGRRTGPKGQTQCIIFLHPIEGGPKHKYLHFPKEPIGKWVEMETTFDVPKDLSGASIYFYNNNSEETVHYDDLRISAVGE